MIIFTSKQRSFFKVVLEKTALWFMVNSWTKLVHDLMKDALCTKAKFFAESLIA